MAVRQRARQDWQKEERRRSIIEAADSLLVERGGQLAPIAVVADRAGVAKGTMYLYFENKDDLYMALLEYRARLWADSAFEWLEKHTRPFTVEDVVEAISHHILENHEVLILATIANSSMEVNIDRDDDLSFRAGLADMMRKVGEAIERGFPGLRPGQGSTMFMRSLAYILGIWQLVAPDPAMEVIREREELSPFRLEFAKEVRAGLGALWAGTLAMNATLPQGVGAAGEPARSRQAG